MTITALNLKVNSVELPSINWKYIFILGFLVSFLLLIFYVWQVNSLTKGYYLINDYEKQIMNLEKENKDLQVSFAENSFWGQAIESIRALNFQKAISIKYIQMPNSSVAILP